MESGMSRVYLFLKMRFKLLKFYFIFLLIRFVFLIFFFFIKALKLSFLWHYLRQTSLSPPVFCFVPVGKAACGKYMYHITSFFCSLLFGYFYILKYTKCYICIHHFLHFKNIERNLFFFMPYPHWWNKRMLAIVLCVVDKKETQKPSRNFI